MKHQHLSVPSVAVMFGIFALFAFLVWRQVPNAGMAAVAVLTTLAGYLTRGPKSVIEIVREAPPAQMPDVIREASMRAPAMESEHLTVAKYNVPKELQK